MTPPLRFGVAHDFRRPLDSEHSLRDVYAQTSIAVLDRLVLIWPGSASTCLADGTPIATTAQSTGTPRV